jgi:hypothetical protein
MTTAPERTTNGHHHGSWYLPATVVGPTQALPQPRPVESSFAPDTAALATPQPVESMPEQHPTSPAASQPRPDEHVPAPPESIEKQMRRDGFEKPKGPEAPGSPVTFPLRKATKIGFAMTVAAAAVGQVMFFASFFGGTVLGYIGAAAIAAFAEVTMVGAGDSALRHKIEGNRGWQMLLAVSGSIAAGATVMQIAHWWAQEPVMALTFGVASIAGWAVHIASGLIEANGYLRKKGEWDAEVMRRQRKREAREDAEYERRRADHESDRQAARRARAAAEKDLPASAPQPVAATKPAAKGTKKPTASELDRDTALRWWRENGQPGPTTVIRHFEAQGYTVPVPSTVRRWISPARNRH